MARRAAPQTTIDFDTPDDAALAAMLRPPGFVVSGIPALIEQALARNAATAQRVARTLVRTMGSREQFVSEGQALFQAALAQPAARRQPLLRGALEGGGSAAALFLVHQMSALKQQDARACMKDYLAAGGSVGDVAHWLRLAGQVLRRHRVKPSDTAGAVVDAVGDTAEWLLDAIEDGVDAVLEGIDAVIDALTTAGVAIVNAFEAVAAWSADQLADLLAALIEAGVDLGQYIAATFDWAYDQVRNFVAAALQVGYDALALIEQTVGQSYFVLRRYVSGLFAVLGSVGAVLQATLTLIERGAALAWRSTMLALRYAGATILAALDWAAAQTQAVFTAIVAAWESIGEDLLTLYEWALDATALVWQMIGEATQTIGNSIYYVYNFLATSGVKWLFDFTRGVMRAKIALASVVGWAVDQAFEVALEVLRAVFDVGTTIADALWTMATRPASAWQTFVQAMLQVGGTLGDLMRAVLVDTAQEFLVEVIDALLVIKQSISDILMSTLEAGAALLAIVVSELCNRLGTYRSLSSAERVEASAAFGGSLDYDAIFLSFDDPLNEILFGLQDFFNNNPDSRAFVTMNLVNFDVDDGQIDRCTLIHELTHVWQSRQVGGVYMAQAIAAQNTGGYNYGYRGDGETLTADGRSLVLAGTLSLPVTPDTLAVYIDSGDTAVATDDAAGGIVFSDGSGAIGSIDYSSGRVELRFASAPVAGTVFTLSREVSLQLNRSGAPSTQEPEAFWLGVGADAALNGAAGDFDAFNREQQGQIMMHWFARRFVAVRGHSGAVLSYDSTPWDGYQITVAAAR